VDKSVSDTDHEATIRSMISEENALINHRVTWMSTLQGLLFAALGFAWDKANSRDLITVFCLLGILVAGFSFHTLITATRAMYRLYRWWLKREPTEYSGPGVMGLPPSSMNWLGYLTPWNFFPVIFFLAWFAILIVNWRRGSH
jgi:hypothetical protein